MKRTDLRQIASFSGEMNYLSSQKIARFQQVANPAVTGTFTGRDPITGKIEAQLPDGGSLQANSILSSSFPQGSVIPSLQGGRAVAFADAKPS